MRVLAGPGADRSGQGTDSPLGQPHLGHGRLRQRQQRRLRLELAAVRG